MRTDGWTAFQLYIASRDGTKRWPIANNKANHAYDCENATQVLYHRYPSP